jgi:pilus assembly protein CpaC
VESTVDVLQDRSLIISGLFNEEREQVRTGVPFLSNIPILRDLFASKQWQNNQSELIVVVTPFIMDPNKPRPIDLLHFERDSVVPARQVLDKRPPVVRPPQ